MLTDLSCPTTGSAPSRRTTPLRAGWHFAPVSMENREGIEHFIAARFDRAYGARITRFMPELVALHRDDTIQGACGLRDAAAGPLFLETYLEEPAERVLSRATGTAIARDGIVEVGNLAIARAGAARRFILRLTLYLHGTSAEWVIFSAVPALRNNFLGLGIPMIPLALADPNRLDPEARAAWGSYYDQSPQVHAVNVDAAFEVLCEAACKR